jgi:hypothetical protein
MTGSSHRRRPARDVALHVVVPVFAGATVYLLWRAETLLVFGWLAALGLAPAVEAARSLAAPLAPLLPPWLLLSAPDGLWVYAFVSALALVWEGAGGGAGPRAWMGLAVAAGLGGELLQGLEVLPGTFDSGDLLACLAGASALLVHRRRLAGRRRFAATKPKEILHDAPA